MKVEVIITKTKVNGIKGVNISFERSVSNKNFLIRISFRKSKKNAKM